MIPKSTTAQTWLAEEIRSATANTWPQNALSYVASAMIRLGLSTELERATTFGSSMSRYTHWTHVPGGMSTTYRSVVDLCMELAWAMAFGDGR